jgi:hypothetical protein
MRGDAAGARVGETVDRDIPEARIRVPVLSSLATGVAVAIAVFLVAYERGTFALTSRQGLAIGLLWALALTALAAPSTFRALRGVAAVPAIALLALAVFSLLSALWASSTEAALSEFNRCVLYAAVYVLAVAAIRRRLIHAWCDGIAWGVTALGIVSLGSRLAPGVVNGGGSFDFLPIAYIRLSYPIGYWNALSVIIAIAIPLLLRGATAPRPPLVRALYVLPIPALTATMYLTSSRGGALAAGASVLALILLSARRWAVIAAVVVGGATSALSVHALVVRRELVNGPLASAAAVSQRGSAAVQIALACVLAAAVYGLATYGWSRFGRPVPLAAERFVAIGALVATLAAVIAVHPIRQFDAFRSTSAPSTASADYVQAHLLSASGNGRWQLWTSGIKEFRAHPLAGGGAGSFQEWWLQHRPLALFVQDAHSLYVEMLGELGVIGLALVLAIVAAAAIAAARIVRYGDGRTRADGAAVAAAFVAFLVAAGVDWMWEVTAVSAAALIALALLARLSPVVQHERVGETTDVWRSGMIRPEAAVAAWIGGAVLLAALFYAEAAPLLAQRKVEASYAAVRGGDARRAYTSALDARDVTPWAASPYLQLALVDEEVGRFGRARNWVDQAIQRDSKNWQLWLVASRLAAKQGQIETAQRDLSRAAALNPLALGQGAVR